MSVAPARRQVAAAAASGDLAPTSPVAHWRLSAPRARVRRWGSALPEAQAPQLLARRLRPLARRTRDALPRDLVAAVEAALAAEWLPTARAAGAVRLAIEDGGEPERAETFVGDVVRIGGGESCQVRLADAEAAEICELRRTGDGWSVFAIETGVPTLLNGNPVEPHQGVPIAPGDQLEVGKAYCTVLVDERPGPGLPRVRLLELLAVSRGDPLVALGRDEDRWVEVRIDDWRGYLCLREPWIAAAYRCLGYAAPADEIAWHNPVDASLTAFALQRLAMHVAATTGADMEVGPPREAAALAGRLEGHGGWLAARLAVEDGDAAFSSVVVWSAGWAQSRPRASRREHLQALPFSVHILGGRASLDLGELGALEPGDVLIPDEWLPRSRRDGSLEGPVSLRLQRWWRPARLMLGERGAQIELDEQGWTDVDEKEQGMTESPEAIAEPGGGIEEELEVTLSFELDRIAVPLKELSTWDEGTTLALERAPDGPLRILLHHAGGVRVVGRGRVVVVEGKLGIQIENWRPGPEGPVES